MRDEPPASPYPAVPTRADYPAIERSVLDRWERDHTFERSIQQRADRDEYVFNDGPPFANGLPHYGHLLTGYVKDVVPRYQTMRGHRVERQFGWDCHGLPVEMEVEKDLGVGGRQKITEFGIDKFNDACRSSVMRYTSEWQDYVRRQARWVDFQHDYKTMDLSYMESVMWAFKQLWDQGLVYEDYRVMPYSWGAETPLSNFEIRIDDATRPRQDPAITVAFTLEPDGAGATPPERILAWTTTPWTLPSNLALAVGPDITYQAMDQDGIRYYLAEATVERYAPQLEGATPAGSVQGRDLIGRTYEPLFPYFRDEPNAFRVIGADFVEIDEGTGVVHIAPGFGEDDQRVGAEHGIGVVVPVDDSGRFTADVPEWAGQNVLEANPGVIDALKARGVLVRHDTYTHNYPHCWRTDTPIIYRALSSWYVEVTAIRDRMVAANQEINWIPEHIRDGQFGKWIEGARDWSISRNRFWGAPIPVWKSDDPDYPRVDVYGSLDELEADFGVRPDDLHRPGIDQLVRPNPDDPTGQSMMRRVPEVLDCWFESGSSPFASVHYPFENAEWFDEHNPADFIVEYIPQTRGWFYTMHVLGVALFDKPAFANVICHGTLLAEDGRKLSKRLRNYAEPDLVFQEVGSDALRWYLMRSPILRGLDFRIDREASGIAETARRVLDPIWNAFYFFTLYANADDYTAKVRTDSPELLDRYLLAKTHDLVVQVTDALDRYDLAQACHIIEAYVDALTNWYIRGSRERFWASAGGDATVSAESKAHAYDTLFAALVTLGQVAAPLLPMLAEEIYTTLTGGDSVHLTDWPDPASLPDDPTLVADMDLVRDATRAALSLREDHGLRARLPLQTLTIVGRDSERLEPLVHLIRKEVNVKEIAFDDDVEAYGSFILRPDGRTLGPRLGKDMKAVMAAARSGEWEQHPDGSVVAAGVTLADGEFELGLEPSAEGAVAALPGNRTVVHLDTTVTPELAAEGAARDLVRHVQQARKTADLAITDRITLRLRLPDGEVGDGIRRHLDTVAEQVLASSVTETDGELATTVTIDDAEVRFDLEVAPT